MGHCLWLWWIGPAACWHVVCTCSNHLRMINDCRAFDSSPMASIADADTLSSYREMAVGNTFGATALSSYGRLLALLCHHLDPRRFPNRRPALTQPAMGPNDFAGRIRSLPHWLVHLHLPPRHSARSARPSPSSSLFFSLDSGIHAPRHWLLSTATRWICPTHRSSRQEASSLCLAAFLAWYNALAGIADDSNRYATISPCHLLTARLRLLLHPSHTSSSSPRIVSAFLSGILSDAE